MKELGGVPDRRIHHVAMYLHLAREGLSVAKIAQQLGLRGRSYVHREIQRQAFDLITGRFLQLARQSDPSGDAAEKWPEASRAGSSR